MNKAPLHPTQLVDTRPATNRQSRQVLEILDRGTYESPDGRQVSLAKEQAYSEVGTKLYTPNDCTRLRERTAGGDQSLQIDVVDATTQEAAHQYADNEMVLLNFASARNPGGGFLGAAKAQEEELCRCSGLYRTLLTQAKFYETHRNQSSLLYSDHLIYSPAVPFFRTAADAPLLESPFVAAVITAPAPNAGAIRRNQPKSVSELPATFLRRWMNILAVAQENQHQRLILGAWGCGAFRNDPSLVADAARIALLSPRFTGAFSHVIFPIPGSNVHSKTNLDVFRKTMLNSP